MLKSLTENDQRILREKEIIKGMSIYLRIAMNYFQVTAIIASLNIEWPYETQKYLSVFLPILDLTGQLLSYECIFLDMNVYAKSIYIRTLFVVILPGLICLYSCVHYGVKRIFTGSSKFSRLFVGVMVTHVFIQPMVLKQLLENFNCVQIDNDVVLASQMDLKYNDGNFQAWVKLKIKLKLKLKIKIKN